MYNDNSLQSYLLRDQLIAQEGQETLFHPALEIFGTKEDANRSSIRRLSER